MLCTLAWKRQRRAIPRCDIMMVTSFPIPGEYDGTAMLPIKILRALRARGVERGPAPTCGRGRRGGARRQRLRGHAIVHPRPHVLGPRAATDRPRVSLRPRTRPALRRRDSCLVRLPAVRLAPGLRDPLPARRRGRARPPRPRTRLSRPCSLERRVCRHAAAIIVLGEAVRHVVVEEKGVAGRASRSSIRESTWPSTTVAEHPAVIPGVGPEHKVVMYVGSIVHPNQGVPVLIDALPASSAGCRSPLRAGRRTRRGRRTAYASQFDRYGDRLIVLSGQTPEQVVALTRRADVLVHPRLACRENYSVQSKIAVYLAAGRPIVATDFGDYTSILGASGAGRLTAVAPGPLAEGIVEVLTDPALASRLAPRPEPSPKSTSAWTATLTATSTSTERPWLVEPIAGVITSNHLLACNWVMDVLCRTAQSWRPRLTSSCDRRRETGSPAT